LEPLVLGEGLLLCGVLGQVLVQGRRVLAERLLLRVCRHLRLLPVHYHVRQDLLLPNVLILQMIDLGIVEDVEGLFEGPGVVPIFHALVLHGLGLVDLGDILVGR